jgi:hypothetical protein
MPPAEVVRTYGIPGFGPVLAATYSVTDNSAFEHWWARAHRQFGPRGGSAVLSESRVAELGIPLAMLFSPSRSAPYLGLGQETIIAPGFIVVQPEGTGVRPEHGDEVSVYR